MLQSLMTTSLFIPLMPIIEFKEILTIIHARDSIISFEELYEKLIEDGSFHKREDNCSNKSSFIVNSTRLNKNKNMQQQAKKGANNSNNYN